jgi:GTP-binding protein
VHCLLSKADKLNRSEQADALRLARSILSSYVDEAGHPLPFSVQLFSAPKRTGVEEADLTIRRLLGLTATDTADTADAKDAGPA